MSAIGRNHLCPCGSGKKYKRCCMAARQDDERRKRATYASLGCALDWLFERHGEAVQIAIAEGFFGAADPEELPDLDELPRGLRDWIEVNLHEWLLAEAEIEVDGILRPAAELLLGPGGPPLAAEGRAQIEELARRPLGLYELVEVRPGEGFWVRDALEQEGPSLWVQERTASRSLTPLSVIGARLLAQGDTWILSGSLYPIPRDEVRVLKEALRARLRHRSVKVDPRLARRVAGQVIIAACLGGLLADMEPPELVDASSGDPLVLVTDHYQVRDWAGLSTALEAVSDIEGSREEGWVRLAGEVSGIGRRVLVSLTPGGGDRLEAFARTLHLADVGRTWLAEVAGELLVLRSREIVDPRGALRVGGAGPRRQHARSQPAEPEISPAERTQLSQQVYESVYAHWVDEPLPALDGRTPREALRSKRGREQVIDLLKLYEHGELRAAAEERREPARLRFLWDELRLDRDRYLG